jgi:hypothetical protein
MDDTREMVRRVFDAYNAHDLSAHRSLYDPAARGSKRQILGVLYCRIRMRNRVLVTAGPALVRTQLQAVLCRASSLYLRQVYGEVWSARVQRVNAV